MCRSRRELSNEYLLATFGFDTAGKEPCKVCPLSVYRSTDRPGNLSLVRCTNLQELVYKQGQAGIVKASVTIRFNNSDPKMRPPGYEMEKIDVTREIIVGGKNKSADEVCTAPKLK